MIKFISLFLLQIIILKPLTAQQNLVSNCSFENLNNCPYDLDQVSFVEDWFSIRITPDLFSSCYNGMYNYCSAPSNSFGYQCPSNGTNYIGYYTFFRFNNSAQEIIASELTDSLVIGQKYFISFKIVLADYAINYATSKHGIKFYTHYPPTNFTDVTNPTDNIVNNFAHFYTNQVISDTMNWATIKGSFIADSNYKYIAIGDFFSYINSDTTFLHRAGCGAYYFLDDICLSIDSNTCNITSQTGCLSNNINSIIAEKSIYIAPNPSKDFFYVFGINGIKQFKIYDNIGQLIKTGELKESEKILISDLNPSLYFIEINGRIFKLIVN